MLNVSSFILWFVVSLVMIVSTMVASGHMLGHLIDKDTAKYEKENRNGVERSHKGRYYGKLARQTIKEIGE